MRISAVMILVAMPAAYAQPPAAAGSEPGSADGTCNVVAGEIEINAAGVPARTPPTEQECEAGAIIVAKLVDRAPREFRREANLAAATGSFGVRIGTPADLFRDRAFDRQSTATWRSRELTVVAFVTSDLAGTTTSVIVADAELERACHYPRWPDARPPGRLSIADIIETLATGPAGTRETPPCYLRLYEID